MKNLIICLLFILVSCSKSKPVAPKVVPDGLKFGESYIFDKLTGAKIIFVDVQDSRCCNKCKCIWSGFISVGLEVLSADNPKQSVKLSLWLREEDRSAVIKIGNQNFKIYFVSVYPDNEDWSNKKEDYSIVLQTTKI
jgi:hypothetical protein